MTKPKLYRYFVREEARTPDAWTSWADIVIGSHGFFAAVSDYGNYVCGGFSTSQDFREFVAELGEKKEGSYFLSKVSKKDQVDEKTTIQEVKRTIIESRKHGMWSAEKARDEWNKMKDYLITDGYRFETWLETTSIDDAWEMEYRTYPTDALMFAERILPQLSKAIRAELIQEGFSRLDELARLGQAMHEPFKVTEYIGGIPIDSPLRK